MKHGYILQHDKEGRRTLMFLLTFEVFMRLHELLDLHPDIAFIEVSNALVVNDQNGIRYNFEMPTGEQFMVFGEHMVAEMQIPDAEVINVDVGSISAQILIHFHEEEFGYTVSAEGLVDIMQTRYDVQKKSEELLNLIAWLKNEAYLEVTKGQMSLTVGGAELAKTLSEGRKKICRLCLEEDITGSEDDICPACREEAGPERKKGSPTPPPKKEDEPLQPLPKDWKDASGQRHPEPNRPEAVVTVHVEADTQGEQKPRLEAGCDPDSCDFNPDAYVKSVEASLEADTGDGRLVNPLRADTPEELKKKLAFDQTPEEKHNAIITILTPMKERGDPAETLVAVGDSAGYLAREVVNAIRVQWPDLIPDKVGHLNVCLACTYPLFELDKGCPACGALDHLPDDVFPADAETLGEAILRIANAIPEPFQRGDILMELHEEERWKDTPFEDVNNELLRLVEETAQLYFDPSDDGGFRVTVREESQKMCIMCGKKPATVNDTLCDHCADKDCECDECKPETNGHTVTLDEETVEELQEEDAVRTATKPEEKSLTDLADQF